MARKTRKIAPTSRLEDHGLELRSDSRMCEEYIQYGGHIDAVVEMMIEMSSSLLHPVPELTRTDEFERVYWRRTPRSRDVGVSRALGQG
jgi:hypothetical protein